MSYFGVFFSCVSATSLRSWGRRLFLSAGGSFATRPRSGYYMCDLVEVVSLQNEIIQTNNSLKNEIIQTNNLLKNEIIQRNN